MKCLLSSPTKFQCCVAVNIEDYWLKYCSNGLNCKNKILVSKLETEASGEKYDLWEGVDGKKDASRRPSFKFKSGYCSTANKLNPPPNVALGL